MKINKTRQMLDFFKLHILNPDIPRIRNNLRLEWDLNTSERTGEVKKITSKFHGLTFEVKINKYLNISGSIHKFWNSIHGRGEQNYNDFSFEDLTVVIIEFCKMFDLTPDSCMLENLEFGVNVSPTIPANEILRSVINHKGSRFELRHSKKQDFHECTHFQYYIKFYDKGLQYDQGNILRFEIKTRKMEFVRLANIQTLSDLLNPAKIERLGAILKTNFNEILFYDYTIPETQLSAGKRLILTQGQNPTYWETYKKTNPETYKKTNPDNYYKKRQRFKELVKKHGTRDIQEIVGSLISQKWNELSKIDPETLQELTGVAKSNITGIDTSSIGSEPVKLSGRDQSTDTPPGGIIPGAEVQGAEPPRRYCLSCGNDITHQRANSTFCSAKYVGEQNAHRCRNLDSNPRNRIKYMIEREKNCLTLFDTSPYFVKRKLSVC